MTDTTNRGEVTIVQCRRCATRYVIHNTEYVNRNWQRWCPVCIDRARLVDRGGRKWKSKSLRFVDRAWGQIYLSALLQRN